MPSPLELAVELQNKGLNEERITSELATQGFSKEQISQAITQSNVKTQIEEIPEPPPAPEAPPEIKYEEPAVEQPQPTGQFQPYTSTTSQQIEQIAEEIIQEKWERFVETFGELPIWKEKIETDVLSIKQEIVRTQDRLNGIERALASKVQEYSESITDLTAEMKALSKLLNQILQPLTSNIKELQRLTEKFKKE